METKNNEKLELIIEALEYCIAALETNGKNAKSVALIKAYEALRDIRREKIS